MCDYSTKPKEQVARVYGKIILGPDNILVNCASCRVYGDRATLIDCRNCSCFGDLAHIIHGECIFVEGADAMLDSTTKVLVRGSIRAMDASHYITVENALFGRMMHY